MSLVSRQQVANWLPEIDRPALVLGSGPNAAPPPGFPEGWSLLTVNGSQAIASGWGASVPEVTLFGTTVLDRRPSNLAAQAVLRGKSTKSLLIVADRHKKLMNRLRLLMIGYRFQSLSWLTTEERRAFLASVLGEDIAGRVKPSNGVFLAIIALAQGAPEVMMTGFSLTSKGHAYNDLSHPRNHAAADAEVLAGLSDRKLPITTNDERFAAEAGIPFSAGL
jgi:hypothetical protein